ncbi:unnamed protein product [Rotaria magnacalcarata]
MYGDLIYLCKRLPIDVCFKRFTELCIYSNGADGHIRKEDTGLILNFFPNLEHFWLHAQSSRTLNRSVEFIAETLLCSLPKLISLRISCRKDSLRVPSFNDDDTCHSWIKRVCGIDNPEDIHIIVGKKELAIWK